MLGLSARVLLAALTALTALVLSAELSRALAL